MFRDGWGTSELAPVIKPLPMKTEKRHHQLKTSYQAWLRSIRDCDNMQSLRLYQHHFASHLNAQSPLIHILSLLEYSLVKKHYPEAKSLARGLQAIDGQLSDDTCKRLKLLAFITSNLTGNHGKPTSPEPSIQELWSSAERESRQLRSLLLESTCSRAENKLANGKCKSIHRELTTIKRSHNMSDLADSGRLDFLLQISGNYKRREVLAKLIRSRLSLESVQYHKHHACALDSISLLNNGRIIIVSGWHLTKNTSPLRISVTKHPRIHASQPFLTHRKIRGDLRVVEERYGVALGTQSGFICTLVLDDHDALGWRKGEPVEVLLSNDETLTRLYLEPTHRDIELLDARNIVHQLIGDDMHLRDHITANKLRKTWKDQVEILSQREVIHQSYGEKVSKPDISILIPLYGRLDFMEFQLHWFFYSQRRRGTDGSRYQIIYCLDNPEQKDNLFQLAQKCEMLYKVPFEILVSPANLGYAGANNLAARYANSKTLLLLNSDIIPRDETAIDTLIQCHQSMNNENTILGAKLLYPSKDMQHVGMTFFKDSSMPGILANSWLNEHPHKHIRNPSNAKLQHGVIEVEATTAACLLISKSLFDQLRGFRLDFISGDFEDSDFCLRIRKLGHNTMVCLDAVFYHLERQSMSLQAREDQDALKIVAFNAYTHHELQAATIEELKCSSIELDASQHYEFGTYS
jgi:GT2 family glycosyltransferase